MSAKRYGLYARVNVIVCVSVSLSLCMCTHIRISINIRMYAIVYTGELTPEHT